jgi:hypothetical protein
MLAQTDCNLAQMAFRPEISPQKSANLPHLSMDLNNLSTAGFGAAGILTFGFLKQIHLT